jgi:hypothetical protein
VTRVIVALVMALTFAPSCAAQARTPFDTKTLHVLARTLVGEADGHTADYAPITFVLLKRWERRVLVTGSPSLTFTHFIRMYSALWKTSDRRASSIRLLPWSAHRGKRSKQWSGARAFVRKWDRGQVTDPCPSAMHWGSKADGPPDVKYVRMRGWAVVKCGDTRNIFYERRGAR